MHFSQMGNEKKLPTKRKSAKLVYVQEVFKRNKISEHIVPPAPEKEFDYPVVLYHLTGGH